MLNQELTQKIIWYNYLQTELTLLLNRKRVMKRQLRFEGDAIIERQIERVEEKIARFGLLRSDLHLEIDEIMMKMPLSPDNEKMFNEVKAAK